MKQHWDHPRMRGEHLPVSFESESSWGSSPHARGALSLAAGVPIEVGIIPACAGSTASLRPSGGSCWDHPRMRGEHEKQPYHGLARAGSSPHARGAL